MALQHRVRTALRAHYMPIPPRPARRLFFMILETAVGCARQCRDRCARQGARTQRAPARKDEQRRMAHRAWCCRVHSGLTPQVNVIEARKSCAQKNL